LERQVRPTSLLCAFKPAAASGVATAEPLSLADAWPSSGGERGPAVFVFIGQPGSLSRTDGERESLRELRRWSTAQPSWWVEAAEIGRYAYEQHADDDDFVQPGALYRDVMSDTDREHLVGNIVAHAGDGVSETVQRRVVEYWKNVDPGLGARVASGLGHEASSEPQETGKAA
jgi:hypothetical protein